MGGLSFRIAWVLLGGRKKLLKVLEKIAFLVENGLPIKEAIDSQYKLANMDRDFVTAKILRRMLVALREGKAMVDGIKDLLSAEEYMLLKNAEKTGKLPLAITNILMMDREKKEAKKVLREGITGPLSVFAVSVLLLYFIGEKVLPPILSFIGRENVHGAARFIVVLSDFVRSPLFPISLVMLFVCGVLVFLSFPVLTGNVRRVLDSLPPWSIYREYAGVVFLLSLSIMVASGVPITQALRQMLPEANPYLKERLKEFARLMSEGMSFGEALYHSGFNFPTREVAYDMYIFSRYPKVEQKMLDVVRERFEMLRDNLRATAKKIGAFLQMLVYLLVIGVVVSVAQIMMQLQGKVG